MATARPRGPKRRYSARDDVLEWPPANNAEISVASTRVVKRLKTAASRGQAPPAKVTEQLELGRQANEIILSYPLKGRGSFNVRARDLATLHPGQRLNDTIIELGLRLWMDDLRHSNPLLASQIHVFSSHFYTKLRHINLSTDYSLISRWTSGVAILDRKYLVFPIHQSDHWYLVIVHHPARILKEAQYRDRASILILDSLAIHHHDVAKKILKYLHAVAVSRRLPESPAIVAPLCVHVEVPLQDNFVDCGVHLLHNIETFMSDPDRYLRAIQVPSKAPDTNILWRLEKAKRKRQVLYELVASGNVRRCDVDGCYTRQTPEVRSTRSAIQSHETTLRELAHDLCSGLQSVSGSDLEFVFDPDTVGLLDVLSLELRAALVL